MADSNLDFGGGEYVETKLLQGFKNKYTDSIHVIYKNHDWNFIINTLNNLKRTEIRLIFDLDYWPISYGQLKFIYHNFRMKEINFLLGESYYYAKKLKVRNAVLIQGAGLNKIKLGIPLNVLNYLKVKRNFPIDVFLNGKNKFYYILYKGIRESIISKIIKYSGTIARAYGVSKGQLDSLGLSKSKKARVMDPPLAVDKDLISKRKDYEKKKDYLVFYARLIPLKGILEIPYILKEIMWIGNNKELKLIIMGKFPNDSLKDLFFNLVKELRLEDNIVYKGFVPKDELLNIVSEAKCVVYPSHEDSFSLAILEALAVGTPVVAYDIPGPRSVFGDLSAVRFVEEFNIRHMAREVTNILRMKEDEYNSLIFNDKMEKFLEKHTNWDSVIENYYKDLMSL